MPIKVYLADDHAIIRDGLRFLLSVRPEIAVIGDGADGRQVVAEVKSLKPDVVIMDISMPGLNGIEATRQILAMHPETHVIILSMMGSAEHIFRALQAGAQGYLLKDSAGQELVEAVFAVNAGRRYFSQQVADTLVQDLLDQHEQSPEKSPLESLSDREHEILQLVIDGKSSAEIGEILSLSQKTVESYRHRLMQKLGVSDLTGLIKFAYQHGLI